MGFMGNYDRVYLLSWFHLQIDLDKWKIDAYHHFNITFLYMITTSKLWLTVNHFGSYEI